MEVLIFLSLITILFLVITQKNNLSTRLDDLDSKMDLISKRLEILSGGDRRNEPATSKPQEPKVEVPTIQPPVRAQDVHQPVSKPEQQRRPVPLGPPVHFPQPKPVERKPNFFERNPDLEKFIGENLANKIGIAILVIGIGFFVKYAIDRNWIGEIGRVFIGILCAGILLGVAHKLRRSFQAFSSVLVGGGIAVLYFTIAIGFHEYGIFSQTAAFMIMVVITGFTILLSIGYDRVELAVLAILGGFGSPFMVSTGEGNYIILFSYMLILNSGMLVLAYYKKWRIVNIVCYVFTIVIFASWLATRFDSDDVQMIRGALAYATLFYLAFFAMNIVNNIRQRTAFTAPEILILLSNTFLYFSAGMAILNNPAGKDFQGLFTAGLGVFNFIFAYLLFRNRNVDKNLVFMLIGLVLTFISLAAPIQLEGNYITLFWATETVLLLWLFQKSGIRLIGIASVAVMILMVISLAIDWKQIYTYNDAHMRIIFNKGCITSIVALASILLTAFRLKRADEFVVSKNVYARAIIMGSIVVLYLGTLLELRHHATFYADIPATASLVVGAYNMAFIVFLLVVSEKRIAIPEQLKAWFPVWGVIAMGAYLFLYHSLIIEARNAYLNGSASTAGFITHYVLIVLLVTAVVLSLRQLNESPALKAMTRNLHWWLYIFFFVFVASAELDHFVALTFYEGEIQTIIEHNQRIGYPILWGIISFALIATGLQRKEKMLRIISLVLFFVTLVKLFVFDLSDIPEGGKIAAFISLGVLLLVVSFMYQRLKRLLLEDAPTK